MQEIFMPEVPLEQREQLLRDNCDQIVERSYTKRFTQAEINEARADLAQLFIQLRELEAQLDEQKAIFKGQMKPIKERADQLLRNLKAGGVFTTSECFKIVDEDEGHTGFYDPQGYLLEERPIQPDERTRNIFRDQRQQLFNQMAANASANSDNKSIN